MPRPKSFDPDTVLTKAMDVFWEKGYDAASISDLTAAMGINRFSLYDTFGDKHTLYLKALESYERSVVEPILERIHSIEKLSDLENHFMGMIDYQREHADAPCCMIHKAAVSLPSSDHSACEQIKSTRSRLHDAFCDTFARLIEKGELRQGIQPEQAAWLIMFTKAGLTSYASSSVPTEQAKSAIKALFDSLRA